MSAAPRSAIVPEYAGLRLTADEFFSIGETEARLELVEGVVAVLPSPVPGHQVIVQELFRQIDRFNEWAGVGAADVFLDTDIWFDGRTVYRPDLAVYRAGRLGGIPERLTTVPDLVIEVLSVGTRPLDLTTKRDGYERFGVTEYIVADPQTGRVQRWVRAGDRGTRFVGGTVEGDSLQCDAVTGLVINLQRVRGLAAGRV